MDYGVLQISGQTLFWVSHTQLTYWCTWWRQGNQKHGEFNTEVRWRTGSSCPETNKCFPAGTPVLCCPKHWRINICRSCGKIRELEVLGDPVVVRREGAEAYTLSTEQRKKVEQMFTLSSVIPLMWYSRDRKDWREKRSHMREGRYRCCKRKKAVLRKIQGMLRGWGQDSPKKINGKKEEGDFLLQERFLFT